ncbi:MAG: hypothetical protein KIT02_06015 [Devosia sp.]|uniref:hypothetical protein n=1 Tax=Devosia sp. TaxID=1871048 RepID=UPI0024C7D97A|nr:hypothetical protein [Devosia sp.]UYO00761.1 MAG: hypothetical protein KIT02_06015 [Devosia sp.]
MKASYLAALAALLVAPGLVQADEAGDRLPDLLYSGGAVAERQYYSDRCDQLRAEACFGLGLIETISSYESLAQALYRHGAIAPSTPAAAFLLGMESDTSPNRPANPDPEPLTYEGLRTILEEFVAGLDRARSAFDVAAVGGEYVLTIDPLRVRIDLDGDGLLGESETLAALLRDLDAFDAPVPSGKTKTKGEAALPDTTVGFDRADAIWFAGYSQVTAIPFDFLLAHDFSQFFEAAMHRIFPEADLPMQDHARGSGTLMMDRDSDAFIADMVAAIHTADFPVTDSERLAGVLGRMKAVTELSRQNWAAIQLETDDNRELVPSPGQTSIVPDHAVTQEVVDAWMETLDTVDLILDGELLIPHWRFEQGFSLKAYFETATETDLVMLFTGQGALPFLRDGAVADEDSFAAGNAVFGDNWPNFIVWFN